MAAPEGSLRVAWLAYRGNPHSGGQGVYTHHVSKELVALGHEVTVFSGPPYPELAPEVPLVKVPSLDLFRPSDPFRVPHPREFRSLPDLAEFGLMLTAGFPEARTFSWRIRKVLRGRQGDFDIVHDNQCLGSGILGLHKDGFPVVATLHHPITVDRDLELQYAKNAWRRFTLRRWYGFVGMQKRVVSQLPMVITVSQSSLRDMCEQMRVRPETAAVVPVGVDATHFRPRPEVATVRGRLMCTTSSDVPLKGLVPLLEALAKIRTERDDAHLVVVGKPREGSILPATIERLGLEGAVQFAAGVDDDRLVELYGEAEVAVVPSLYEGFSLPAIEAMACGRPLVATTGGALPEVVGRDGDSALLVPPADPGALAAAIMRVLDDPDLQARLGAAGRARVLDRYTWAATARGTAEKYREFLENRRGGSTAAEC
jgi:glycosyltransferase involved in cell wall biosynthesis